MPHGREASGNDHYDDPWKEFLDIYFPKFLKYFFPQIYKEIDWKRGFESLEQELREIIPETENGKEGGKRYVDKLIKVYRKSGEEAWVYIHIEIQSQRDKDLPKRVYDYHCLLYVRYLQPIMSLVVLGDEHPNWRPESFSYELWGCQTSLTFRTVKLLDYRDRIEELMKSRNPFAYFVIAHLRTLETRGKPEQRLEYKKALVLEMLELGLGKKEVYNLLKYIDYLMRLPEDVEQEYLGKIREYQEKKQMPIIAPIEQIAKEEGRVEEAQAAVLDILNDRFGDIPASLVVVIQSIKDLSLLREHRRQVLKVNSLEEYTRQLKDVKPN